MNETDSRTVVVVDDDAPICHMMSAYLRRLGYEARQALQPEKGLDMVLDTADLALVVCDVQMPRMTGPELIERAAAARPGLRVLFVSGYDLEALRESTIPGVVHSTLGKPFSFDMFSRAIEGLQELADAC